MSKVKLAGLDMAVRDLGNRIKISKEESFNKKCKSPNIRIDIKDKDGKVVNGITNENLIEGLIICSNYYLPDNAELDIIKGYKTKLEKCIKQGAVVEVEMSPKLVRLSINVKGMKKYNYYGNSIIDTIKLAETLIYNVKSLVKEL